VKLEDETAFGWKEEDRWERGVDFEVFIVEFRVWFWFC
jgi:hypothetical protein